MSTDTYLELVSDFITETGLNGSNPPSSIAAASGDALKAVYWIRVADLTIQRERIDWDFLWEKPIVNLAQGSNIVPPQQDDNSGSSNAATHTALINVMSKKKLGIIDANGEVHFPEWMHWDEFSTLYDYVDLEVHDSPAWYSINPARVIKLSSLIESSGLTCKYEYWRKPLRLRAGTDTTRIPDDFTRLVVLQAKIMYAEHEDAPEVSAGSHEEYDILLDQMLSVHAPDSQWSRMQSSDQFLEVINE